MTAISSLKSETDHASMKNSSVSSLRTVAEIKALVLDCRSKTLRNVATKAGIDFIS
jgi:hypothetical protein